jgi:hypothetical protein
MKKLKKLNERGSIILVFIITLPFLIAITMYYMSESLTSFQVSRYDQLHTEAQAAADAGADYAIEQLAQNSSWTGTSGDFTLQNANNIKTAFSASVSGGSTSKTISITGKTYWPSTVTTPTRSVSIYVDLYPVTTGNYSIVTGAGGLYMSNSAKVVGGDVFINGEISMSNNSQIGLSTNPVTVQVADEICPSPADSTYPKVCASGNPITIAGAAHIYGTVTATNQTNGSGMSNTGLVTGGTTAPQALPSYDRAAQEAAVSNTITGPVSCSSGSLTWPANTKITGNVNISNTCTVDIMGNVWITGNLTMSNSSNMTIDNSAGSTRPVIMVDGSSGASFSNGSQITANTSGTGAEVITFYSTASCNPECSSVTGTDLYNSRSIDTITLNNNFQAPNSILYAYWSQVDLSNAGQIGAVIGQTLKMTNNATITFGSGGTGLGNTTWVVRGYRKQ